jgi:hypothetical protein
MKNLFDILVIVMTVIAFAFVLSIFSSKQVRKDCLNAQRHLLEYNVPIPEDLHSLCVELNIYN